jgi:PAS domain-containing protein
LVDSVGFGLLLFGRDGLIIDCNDAALSLLNLPRQELVLHRARVIIDDQE